MKKEGGKYSTIHYQSYLKVPELLDLQHPRSAQLGVEAHDEMLFIIVHQVYELWFKQVIHEIVSVKEIIDKEVVPDRELSIAVARLERVVTIMEHMVDQVGIIETMTPLDFLDFRNYLFPASGFQSFQFREVESMLGLPKEQRITYHGQKYDSVFTKEQQESLDRIYAGGTLLESINRWLERTPFLQLEGFDFLEEYRKAVKVMISKENDAIMQSDYLSEKEKTMRSTMLGSTDTYFNAILNRDTHAELMKEGKKRLSYEATVGALFINLYRDEPILQLPFQLIISLINIDNQLTTWRYRHAQMVLRMIGNKVGTGGSSGHEYLAKTASKHQIFTDFHNVSTLLIPRTDLPKLPDNIRKQLSFHFKND